MTVAPELFDPKHGLKALQLVDKVLRSPLGMKTLDPMDLQYRPNYDNSNDSTDASIAKGLNYHNVCRGNQRRSLMTDNCFQGT
jgi:glycogen debranching enzyme